MEVEYLQALVIDLDADLAQFDEAEAWMRRQEAAASTVLALYQASPPTDDRLGLATAVETAGWQYSVAISRNTLEDLRSTGNLRLITNQSLRRAIATYYATVEEVSIPIAAMRDRMWDQYDAHVANVLKPGVRLSILQRDESFGLGITSDALEPSPAPEVDELIAALKAYPALEVAAGDVLVQSINNRASVATMRKAALDLRADLEQWLAR